ncbi:MAG: hypothetical protein IT180_04710 [Acidobacteria bacterium]|nr:hypothetical protein [Acidobacteriota bacterium]
MTDASAEAVSELETAPSGPRPAEPVPDRDAAGRFLPGNAVAHLRADLAATPHPSDPERNALGRFVAGNGGAVQHGAYAEATVAALKAEDVQRILADRGHDDVEHPPSVVYCRLVEKFAGACIVLDSLETFIGTEPISGKGRAKRALTPYLAVLDRVVRLAAIIGVERVPRPVNESPSAWLARLADERRKAETPADK